jgi:hypothetical protein
MGELEAMVLALEYLEVGDVSGAVAVLLSALENGPENLERSRSGRPYRCACGSAFEWPGLLDRHLISCLRAAA